jgi:hypothetical protein
MAKRFLETLGDAFDDSVLEDVIPVAEGRPLPKRKKSRSGRKKGILRALDEAFEVQRNRQQQTPTRKGKKKSFLQNLNDDFGETDLGGLVPSPAGNKETPDQKAHRKAISRFTTSLDQSLLEKIRGYARENDLRVSEVIQEAVKIYLEKGE